MSTGGISRLRAVPLADEGSGLDDIPVDVLRFAMIPEERRTLMLQVNDLLEEIAGFPHSDPEEARLFSCGITWSSPGDKDRGERRALAGVDLHDRGGRARFRTPDGRELSLELHGRDWPMSAGRESLVLILRGASASSDTIASSWTSLDAARVGIDIGWLAVDCAPVISETGEQHS